MRHLTSGDFRQAKEKIPHPKWSVARKTYKCNDCKAKILPGQVYARTIAYPDIKRFGSLPLRNMGGRGRMVEVKMHIRCGRGRFEKEIVHRVCTALGIIESESGDRS